jgi:hypothetical protein
VLIARNGHRRAQTDQVRLAVELREAAVQQPIYRTAGDKQDDANNSAAPPGGALQHADGGTAVWEAHGADFSGTFMRSE